MLNPQQVELMDLLKPLTQDEKGAAYDWCRRARVAYDTPESLRTAEQQAIVKSHDDWKQ